MNPHEPHHTVQYLAKRWKLRDDTIRRMFRDEPGVIRLDSPERLKKRGYLVLRIPESVASRKYRELTGRRN